MCITTDSVSWDATTYASQLKKTCAATVDREDELTRAFEPLVPTEAVLDRTQPLPVVAEPAVFTDCEGRIMAVSLPSLLAVRHQVSYTLQLTSPYTY